ncbi:MAG: hypothetical protein OEY23_25585, partial [Acidimicrobiia bacterium]|nr:hypothetical protein [Acidimicrobiia bacterium]
MTGDYLFELLPRYYRWRDSELSGNTLDPHAMGPLQGYLAHLQDVVVDELRAAIGQLYDNLFIETCEPWVIPLIADLVGLEATTHRGDGPTRSQVANAIGHEARKGLAITITEAVEDATGWPARVRAAVDGIAFTQSVSAPVTDRGVTIDVRPQSPPGAHLMDVRVRQPAARPRPRSGSLGLQPNTVSVAVWPTQIYPMRRAALRAVGPGRYTFNPLGVDTSLLEMPPNHRLRDGQPADEASIYVDGRLLDPSDLTIGDLASWQPSDLGGGPTAVLDPTRGRFWLRDVAKHVAADFAYGLCGDIGGGPYLRGGDHRAGDHRHRVDIGRDRTGTESGRHAGPPTLRQAIDQLDTILAKEAGRGESAVVLAIADNEFHRVAGDSVTNGPVVRVPDTVSVIIRAEDGYRPCLVGDIVILGRGRFILDGCTIAGSIRVAGPVSVELRHCTVANLDPPTGPWPGRPSVVVEA